MHMCTRTRIHRAPTHTHTHTPAVHPCLRAVCSMAHLLTPDVETCAARNARLVLETAKFVLALNKDQAQQYLDKVCLCLWLWLWLAVSVAVAAVLALTASRVQLLFTDNGTCWRRRVSVSCCFLNVCLCCTTHSLTHSPSGCS